MPCVIMVAVAIVIGLFMMAPLVMCGILAAIILLVVIMGCGALK